jgi:hypothetical protein
MRLEVPSSGSELERRRIEGADARPAIAAAQRGPGDPSLSPEEARLVDALAEIKRLCAVGY